MTGSINGGDTYEFYATSATPDGTGVPATLDESTPPSHGTSTWPEYFFADGTTFGRVHETSWSYVYNATGTCEQWTAAYNNGDGGQAADGDIAGVNQCSAP